MSLRRCILACTLPLLLLACSSTAASQSPSVVGSWESTADAASVPAYFFLPDGAVTQGVILSALGNQATCNMSGSYAVSGNDLTISYSIVKADGTTVTESCSYAMTFSNGGDDLAIAPASDAGCGGALELERTTITARGNCL